MPDKAHSVERGYSHRDPPLTEAGQVAATRIELPASPDLIIISPMTRTIQTALLAFDHLIGVSPFKADVQVWPDLREAHDANCNKGLPRAEIAAKFPQFHFLECPEEWDYPAHTVEGATLRAERVRQHLKVIGGTYKNIALITHRGLTAFLVQGQRFDLCGMCTQKYVTEPGDDYLQNAVPTALLQIMN